MTAPERIWAVPDAGDWDWGSGIWFDKAEDSTGAVLNAPCYILATPAACTSGEVARAAGVAERERWVEQLCDALHLCDTEALDICMRIGGNCGGPCQHPDGVQVLEDAEKIIRAAAAAIRAGTEGGE